MNSTPKQYSFFILSVVIAMLLSSCGGESSRTIQSESHESRGSRSGTLFAQVSSEESGLVLRNVYDDPEMWRSRYQEFQGGAIGTGIAAGDVDGDGWLDLYVVSKTGPNALYRQTGPLTFEDITETAGVAGGREWGSGASFADVDGDGDLDLYVCYINAPNLLYLNDGTGVFTEAGAEAGLDLVSGSVIGAFEDYDHDGDLDVFVLTNVADASKSASGEPDYLFRNDGKGRFEEVSLQSGLSDMAAKGHSATWWDANGDGWSDLYIANDFEAPDFLYINNGDGTFRNGREDLLPHTAWFSMGSDFCDINNDGLFDLLVADMAGTTHFKQKVTMGDMGGLVNDMDLLDTPQYMVNAFYVNSGSDRFLEASRLLGVGSTDWTWSTRFEDLDGDGLQDLHVTNGMARSFNDSDLVNRVKRARSREEVVALMKRSPVLEELNLAYRNTGKWYMERAESDWGLEHVGVSFGSVLADLDRDGDVDIVYANYEGSVSLYRNDSQSNAVTVSLKGTRSNGFGVGAQLFLEYEGGTQSRQVSLARGALSSSIVPIHFGLGEEETVESLTVHWPSGARQVVENLQANRHYTISETDNAKAPAPSKSSPTLFADRSQELGLDFANEELVFNDMVRQPLLPNRMNTLGGGLAMGDADGDGDADLYFAGAKGQTGALYLNDGKGSFRKDDRTQPWSKRLEIEEMAPAWIDANGDGALDLYVTSGSVEHDAGSDAYQDALYVNDGSGQFSFVPSTSGLSFATSASVVSAADFDRDGDMDLFVGGRVVPGGYPESPESFLLENVDGSFRKSEQCDLFKALGMVTSSVWSDANGDGWLDLVVAGEWEPLRVFLNREGRLEALDAEQSGLAKVKGLWNALEAADVDGDGDMDYIASNLGLNTKYKASAKKPTQIFYGDFEGRGSANIVEAKFEGDLLYPVRGKSCSTAAMPSLGAKFPTFNAFASAMLDDIYDVNQADVFEATELAHGVFINGGAANFTFKPLPRLAQVSIGFGLAARDFNGDGHVDIAMGHNFNGPQVETARFDGGLGLLMLGDGTGAFEPVESTRSGIAIGGEARGMAVGDLNNDGWPDLTVSRTNDSVLALVNSGSKTGRSVAISLNAAPHLTAGASLLAKYKDGTTTRFEIQAGSGYLSQSEPVFFVGSRSDNPVQSGEISWANGKTTSVTLPQSGRVAVDPSGN